MSDNRRQHAISSDSWQNDLDSKLNSYSTQEPRRCWICFGEDQDSEGCWVKPCPCSLVCHEQCLLDWIAENQKGRTMKKVQCPQCGIPYYLFERQSVPLVCLEFLQAIIRSTAPYVTILGLGCSILIAASTYGAYTVLTLFGAKEGERWLGHTHSWTWRTFLGLPAIPFVLIASRSRLADGIMPIAALLLLRSNATLSVSWPPSPALVIGSLPWIRLVYFSIYHLIRRRLAQQLQLPSPVRRRVRFALIYGRHGSSTNQDSTLSSSQTRPEESRLSGRDSQDLDILYGRSDRDLNVTVMSALLWPTISSLVGK
ncbi:hypothetical protein DM01DRAFT_1307300 [Hesseltinella vesiculosa]|uniref:RING-CH-type domain-containing protein n=1 Tax=Hesseltinella vesiculosa TaxID=101127 RepID=A0A1X2GDU3_9FUNG|nr:hypothetical protein DM01DRAFT_1307300 [Hesseltinella vesiculosa]